MMSTMVRFHEPTKRAPRDDVVDDDDDDAGGHPHTATTRVNALVGD